MRNTFARRPAPSIDRRVTASMDVSAIRTRHDADGSRVLWWVMASLACLLAFSSAQAAERVALVVANAVYPSARVPSAIDDAAAISSRLRQFGFRVLYLENADTNDFVSGVEQIEANIEPGTTALFYFSGFARQVGGTNYIVPAEVAARSEELDSKIGRAHV